MRMGMHQLMAYFDDGLHVLDRFESDNGILFEF
jgi:hypothetical protein